MTWTKSKIDHNGNTKDVWVHGKDLEFEMSFENDVKLGDTFTIDNKSIKAVSVENVGGRNETLKIKGELDGKSTKGGTSVKTGEGTAKSKTND